MYLITCKIMLRISLNWGTKQQQSTRNVAIISFGHSIAIICGRIRHPTGFSTFISKRAWPTRPPIDSVLMGTDTSVPVQLV